jgi:hypothetical protein
MSDAFRTQSSKAMKAIRAGLWKSLKKEIAKNARN